MNGLTWRRLSLTALILCSAATAAQPPKHTKKALAEIYLRVLHDEGYKAKVDKDGDIEFSSEKHPFWLIIHEALDADSPYPASILTTLDLDRAANKAVLLEVTNAMNRDSGFAKTLLGSDAGKRISLRTDFFLVSPEDLKVCAFVYVNNIHYYRHRLARLLREARPKAAGALKGGGKPAVGKRRLGKRKRNRRRRRQSPGAGKRSGNQTAAGRCS